MRTLTALTTTVAIAALTGVANAQGAAAGGSARADEVQGALTAYAAYQADVTELRTARINTANELEGAIDRASRHNRDTLARGWIAYGAMTAAQSPAFVQGVRDAAAYYGRDAVIWAINADPAYASGLRGGAEATRLVLDSANADGARIFSVADRYLEMAYALQGQRWARAVAPGQPARIQRVRALSAPGGTVPAVASDISPRLMVSPASLSPGADPSAFGGRRFWDAIRGGPQVVEASAQVTYQWRANPTRAEAVHRMTSIAALQSLDAAGVQASAVNRLLSDQRSRDCLEMAHLQLYQCMSAARFRYENAYCLGQHALKDIGICISDVAQPDGQTMTALPARP